MRIQRSQIFLVLLTAMLAQLTVCAAGRETSHPDFPSIRTKTLNPDSEYYYPTLLKAFLSNDTTMTDQDYHYLYYGIMFQEDYNPYRPNPFAEELKATQPLYFRHGTLSRNEKQQIQRLAEKMLANNPLSLTQLSYLVYVYEQLGKQNLANIWRNKLNHLILTISRSGSGSDKEHAIVISDPSHEFEFFNLSGATVESQEFQEPYYERVTVRLPGATDTKEYWFDLHHILEQYYDKHPSER